MTTDKNLINELFESGAHFGFKKTRRHPSVVPFLYGTKDGNDIINLEDTEKMLSDALDFVASIAKENKKILFVGSKNEAKTIIKSVAERLSLPYVSGRWIGGTLTNFKEIRKRVERLINLIDDEEKGRFDKYTKKERLLLNREIDKLQNMFGGIVDMDSLPEALFVVDSEAESTAMREAQRLNLPVIALVGTDCDISKIKYPILANDSAKKSIEYIVNLISKSYENAVDKQKGNTK